MTRSCLRCERQFHTEEKFIRLCTPCRKFAVTQEASIPVYSVVRRRRTTGGDETLVAGHGIGEATC